MYANIILLYVLRCNLYLYRQYVVTNIEVCACVFCLELTSVIKLTLWITY